jgi:MSHA pilin protein MshD
MCQHIKSQATEYLKSPYRTEMAIKQTKNTFTSRNLSSGFRSQGSSGFTLIELVMTIVILGFLSMILVPFYTSITHSPDPMLRQQAVSLGQALMDEILAMRWDENTPVGGGPIGPTTESVRGITIAASTIGRDTGELANNRTNWDDVDDYDGHANTDTFYDQNNNPFTLKGYNRYVTVTYIPSNSDPITADSPPGVTASTQATDTKRIVVTVTNPLQETFTLVSVSCNF